MVRKLQLSRARLDVRALAVGHTVKTFFFLLEPPLRDYGYFSPIQDPVRRRRSARTRSAPAWPFSNTERRYRPTFDRTRCLHRQRPRRRRNSNYRSRRRQQQHHLAGGPSLARPTPPSHLLPRWTTTSNPPRVTKPTFFGLPCQTGGKTNSYTTAAKTPSEWNRFESIRSDVVCFYCQTRPSFVELFSVEVEFQPAASGARFTSFCLRRWPFGRRWTVARFHAGILPHRRGATAAAAAAASAPRAKAAKE